MSHSNEISILNHPKTDRLQSIQVELERFINSNYKDPNLNHGADEEYDIPTFLRRRRWSGDTSEISEMLSKRPKTFIERLMEAIAETGLTEPEVYKRANIDRKLYSKMKNDTDYRPSKRTAIAVILALELPYDKAIELLQSAGFSLSDASKFDVIIKYFMLEQESDLTYINEILYHYNESPL